MCKTKLIKLGLFSLLTAIIIIGYGGSCGTTGNDTTSVSSGSSTPQQRPSVTTNPATNITFDSATLNGTVNSNGLKSSVYFQWGKTDKYGRTTDYHTISAVRNNVVVSADLSGLSSETTYHFRLAVAVSGHTVYGVDESFTTLPLPPPIQVTLNQPADRATNIPINIQLSWTPARYATSYDIYFGTTSPGTFQTNTVLTSFSPSVLSFSTTYYWRIDSKNSTTTIIGNVCTFTTRPPILPSQVNTPNPTDGAINVSINTQLSWARADDATYYDVYFGRENPPTSLITTTTNTSYNPGALYVNTKYYWRIDSKNSEGTKQGAIWSFTTSIAPTVLTNPATNITYSSATLNGTVNPNNLDTTVYFEYGISATPPSYPLTTTSQSIVRGINNVPVSANINRLLRNTTYNFRLVATNAAGINYGDSQTFKTASQPNIAAAAYGHSLCIKSNGELWACGKNSAGELGDGTTTQQNYWVRIGTDTDWQAIFAGGTTGSRAHSLGIKTDGTLWTWGSNEFGQLGQGDYGTSTNRYLPTKVGSDTDWQSVSAGTLYNLALKTDGTLWAWGYNADGQFGDGTNIDKYLPTKIGTDTWKEVSAGHNHSLGIKSDGTLWTWGSNLCGQLGNPAITPNNYAPVRIGTDTWLKVSAGAMGTFSHSLGIKSDGTLWAWGSNCYGQLGLGDTVDRYSPTQVTTPNDGISWRTVKAAAGYSICIRNDNTIWSWGSTGSVLGMLGRPTGGLLIDPLPGQIGTANDWVSVACGRYHSISLRFINSQWELRAWGDGTYGQKGGQIDIN